MAQETLEEAEPAGRGRNPGLEGLYGGQGHASKVCASVGDVRCREKSR